MRYIVEIQDPDERLHGRTAALQVQLGLLTYLTALDARDYRTLDLNTSRANKSLELVAKGAPAVFGDPDPSGFRVTVQPG